MSVVRPGDEASGGGYPTSNSPGHGLGQLLGLSGQQVEETKDAVTKEGKVAAGKAKESVVAGTEQSKRKVEEAKDAVADIIKASEKTQSADRSAYEAKGTSKSTAHESKHMVEGGSERTTESRGQLVMQQAGAEKWEQAAEETLAARNAAGKVDVSKAELEHASRRFEELHEAAMERANKAIAAAEKLDNLEDKVAAKDAAVHNLLQDMRSAKQAAEKFRAEEDAAKKDADKAVAVHKEAAGQADHLPQKIGEKQRRAEELRAQIDSLTESLRRLQDDIKSDEAEGAKVRQKAASVKKQVHAKAGARDDAAGRREGAEDQVEKLQQELGQQQRDKEAAVSSTKKLQEVAKTEDNASKEAEARKASVEEEVKSKTQAVQEGERTAQKHWEQAKKLGDSADAESETVQAAAIKTAEKSTGGRSVKTTLSSGKVEATRGAAVKTSGKSSGHNADD